MSCLSRSIPTPSDRSGRRFSKFTVAFELYPYNILIFLLLKKLSLVLEIFIQLHHVIQYKYDEPAEIYRKFRFYFTCLY